MCEGLMTFIEHFYTNNDLFSREQCATVASHFKLEFLSSSVSYEWSSVMCEYNSAPATSNINIVHQFQEVWIIFIVYWATCHTSHTFFALHEDEFNPVLWCIFLTATPVVKSFHNNLCSFSSFIISLWRRSIFLIISCCMKTLF